MGLPPSDHDPERVRELADDILAHARYDDAGPSLPDRILGWLGDRLADLIERLVGGDSGALWAWVILLGAAAAVVYLLARYGRITVPGIAPGHEPEVMVELSRTAAEWRAEADRLEADGRWREALRCRYRALVADLVRRGTIPEQAGRTAGEYVRDVLAREPDVAPAFAAATELFEAVWYGGADAGPGDGQRFRDLDARVLAVRV